MQVRDATRTDADAIRGLADEAWRDAYVGLLRPTTIDAFLEAAYATERLERRIAQNVFLVVEEGGEIIAFADAVAEGERLNLAAIYAAPARRGQGAGTLLLDELRARFAGLPVSADVLVGNRAGEPFYEQRGFVPRETIPVELFGESAVERRWWLDATLDT